MAHLDQGALERFSRLILPRLAISLQTPAHCPTLITVPVRGSIHTVHCVHLCVRVCMYYYTVWPFVVTPWCFCTCQNSRRSSLMLIYQIQKRKTYSHWLLVGPATDRRARCTSHYVLYMYRLDFDLRTVYNVCMHALCYVMWDQMVSKLRSCDWPSFKINRPHLAYDFPLEFQWEN